MPRLCPDCLLPERTECICDEDPGTGTGDPLPADEDTEETEDP